MFGSLKRDWNLGRYQWYILSLHLFSVTAWSYGYACIIFITPKVDHWCYDSSESFQNLSESEQRRIMADECSRPILDFDSYTSGQLAAMDFSDYNRTGCSDGFVYRHDLFDFTATEKFDLVCDRDWLRNFINTGYMFGQLLASIMAGALGDRYGRRPTMLAFSLLGALMHLGEALASSISVFVLARFFAGIGDSAAYISACIISLELMKTEHRKMPRVLVIVSISCTIALLGVLVMWLRNSDHLLYFIATLYLTATILDYFFYPDSPRWLASRNRSEDLKKITDKISRINGECDLMNDLNIEERIVEVKKATVLDLFRTPALRTRTLVSCSSFAASGLVWFAVMFVLQDFGPDVRISSIISSLLDIPGIFFILISIDRLGRQISGCLYLSLSGLCCLAAAPLVQESSSYILMSLALLGRMFACMSLSIVYVHIPELFPTVCRSTAFGLSSTVARVAGMLAPQLLQLNRVWPPLSVVVLGLCGLLSAALIPLVPDTTGLELAQTLEEGENFCQGHKYKLVLPSTTMRRHDVPPVAV